MNNQRNTKKEPVPLGPAQELEALLPVDKVDKKERRQRERHSRIVTTPLIILLILATLRVFHNHRHKSTNHPADETISKNVETSPTVVIVVTEAATTNTQATEPARIESTNTTTASTKSEATTTTTTTQATTESTTTTTTTTTNSTLDSSAVVVMDGGSRRFYTSYQVRWGAFYPCIFPYCLHPGPSGCLLGGTGPCIRIWCGGQVDYIPQSNCHLEQAITSTASSPALYCQGTLDWMDSSVLVTCSGTTKRDLQLDVQLDGHSYRCNKILTEHHTWNGVVYEKGGAVGHQVSIATRSSDDKDKSAWTEIVSDRRTAHCSTGTQCLDTYLSCQGPDACQATVPYLVASADPQHVATAAIVASQEADGEACTNNYTCQSGKCEDGACRGEEADKYGSSLVEYG